MLSFGSIKDQSEHIVFSDMSREIFPVEDRVIFQSCIDEFLSCCPCLYSRLFINLLSWHCCQPNLWFIIKPISFSGYSIYNA